MTSQADKARIAQTLFEEEGVQLMDMLDQGSMGLRQMRQEAHLLGAVMDQESIESSREFWLLLKRLGHLLSRLSQSFVSTLLPALRKTAQAFEFVGRHVNSMIQHTTILKTAMGLLGAAALGLGLKMVIAFAPVILTFTAIASAVAAVVLAIDDLYNLFTGGESVSGKFFGGIQKYLQDMILDGGMRKQNFLSHQNSVLSKTNQNLKVDVHVQSGANPHDIGSEVARRVGLELDRVHRNTYLALVPQ